MRDIESVASQGAAISNLRAWKMTTLDETGSSNEPIEKMPQAQRPPRYAGFWIRFIADLIDSIVLTVASWVLELMFLGLVYWIGKFHTPFQDAFNPLWLQVFNGFLYLVIAFPYYTWGHYRYGTTLGKRPFRIYVVSESTRLPISMKQSVLRTLGYAASYLPLCAGFLMAAFHPEKRALHDLIAGTVSIKKGQS